MVDIHSSITRVSFNVISLYVNYSQLSGTAYPQVNGTHNGKAQADFTKKNIKNFTTHIGQLVAAPAVKSNTGKMCLPSLIQCRRSGEKGVKESGQTAKQCYRRRNSEKSAY